jgi:hypothetical protein
MGDSINPTKHFLLTWTVAGANEQELQCSILGGRISYYSDSLVTSLNIAKG